MTRWSKNTRKLRKNHGWTARPGCRIFVADRGAVRFQFPGSWVVSPDPDSVKIRDKPHPDDDCTLAVSYLRLPHIDWSGLPLASLVETATQGDERPIHYWGNVVEAARGGVEIAWREMHFIDPTARREARSRLALARRGGIQALITFEFWESDLRRCKRVWDLVLATIELDDYIQDPTRGPIIH